MSNRISTRLTFTLPCPSRVSITRQTEGPDSAAHNVAAIQAVGEGFGARRPVNDGSGWRPVLALAEGIESIVAAMFA